MSALQPCKESVLRITAYQSSDRTTAAIEGCLGIKSALLLSYETCEVVGPPVSEISDDAKRVVG